MMTTYHTKYRTVEAQRFDLENIRDIARWCNGTVVPAVNDGSWIVIGSETAIPGNYIVKTPDGFIVLTESEFTEEYETVGGTDDRAYLLARLIQTADPLVPELHMNHSVNPFGDGYHVDLGGQRFTQSQWEAVQLYVAGTQAAAELDQEEKAAAQIAETMSMSTFFDEDEYVGELSRIVFEALGAASTCWENLGAAGEFDSTGARQIGEKLLDDLRTFFTENPMMDPLFHEYLRGVNMMQDQNKAFHNAMQIPSAGSPQAIPQSDVPVVIELIREEFIDELIPALGARVIFTQDGKIGHLIQSHVPNVVEIYDALIDILYVVFGALNRAGMQAGPGYIEVQASNMSKLGADGQPIIAGPNDPDGIFEGRVKKGPNYFKPNLAQVLRDQGWEG
jgi:predicted HAD superfamily Cof-like phosphohydrolase